MKGKLFKKLCSLYAGLVVFFLTGNAAFADVVPPTAGLFDGGSGGLILILGLVVVALAAVAVAVVVNIRKKNAK